MAASGERAEGKSRLLYRYKVQPTCVCEQPPQFRLRYRLSDRVVAPTVAEQCSYARKRRPHFEFRMHRPYSNIITLRAGF
jgi:hypothetical protein